MKARAKRLDNGEFVDGQYHFMEYWDTHTMWAIDHAHKIDPLTLQYKVGDSWYTEAELELLVHTKEK